MVIYRDASLFAAFQAGAASARRAESMRSARNYRQHESSLGMELCIKSARRHNHDVIAALRRLRQLLQSEAA